MNIKRLLLIKLNRSRSVLLVAMIVLFAFPFPASWMISRIVNTNIQERIERIEQERAIKIAYSSFHVSPFLDFEMDTFRVSSQGEPVLTINKIRGSLNFWRLIIFQPTLSSLTLDAVKVNFIKTTEFCNYDFLFRATSIDTLKRSEQLNHKPNFSKQLSRLISFIFRAIPLELQIKNLSIQSSNKGVSTDLYSKQIEINNGILCGNIQVEDSIRTQNWVINGEINKSDMSIAGSISGNTPKDTLVIPYLDQVYQAQIAFRNTQFNLNIRERSNHEVKINIKCIIDGLTLDYWRIADQEISLSNLSFDTNIKIDKVGLEVDSTSTVTLNNFAITPYLRVEKNPNWHVIFLLNSQNIDAKEALNAMPNGLFTTLKKTQLKGSFDYHLLCSIDLNCLDSLRFEASVDRNNISIVSYGELATMNSEFLHTAYEKGVVVRTFPIGPSHPFFRTLDRISPNLQQAVLSSEDGAFFAHRGFLIDALREALIHDLKVQRFARGGSTISMQLVKNVFLSKDKNITRKLEEAAIVWLIENKQITSKQRMFECYLNLIEWGPRIYGAEEAAQFYFAKPAANLTPQEAIFMASIIPNPRSFAYSFDSNGRIKENRTNHFRIVAERMARNGLMDEADAAAITPQIELRGEAKKQIKQQSDTTNLFEDEPPLHSPHTVNRAE